MRLCILKDELNRVAGTRRRSAKPRRQRSGVGAKQLRAHPRVQFVDGRDQGFEDWFIYLHFGWHWRGRYGEHAFGFTTLREALAAVEEAEPCDCEECQSANTAA